MLQFFRLSMKKLALICIQKETYLSLNPPQGQMEENVRDHKFFEFYIQPSSSVVPYPLPVSGRGLD